LPLEGFSIFTGLLQAYIFTALAAVYITTGMQDINKPSEDKYKEQKSYKNQEREE